jgi:hypothetical protein
MDITVFIIIQYVNIVYRHVLLFLVSICFYNFI